MLLLLRQPMTPGGAEPLRVELVIEKDKRSVGAVHEPVHELLPTNTSRRIFGWA